MHCRLFFILTIISLTSRAQIPDVPAAFNAIKTTPEILHLKRNHIKVPSGGHLQGIQALSDTELVITASSSSYAYYLTANKNQLTSIQKLSSSPFRHAGGCQVISRILFVGVEDNVGKDSSRIMIAGHFDPGPSSFSVIKRGNTFKRSTAGAVGIAQVRDSFLLAVADWDSKNIDLYTPRPSKDNSWNFDSLTTFHAPDDHHWPSYQSINLLIDTAGRIYLIGFALDGTKDRADLYEVTLSPGRADLKLISTRNFKCRGTSFRYGSGIYVNEARQLHIYSCARNVTAHTAINIFRQSFLIPSQIR